MIGIENIYEFHEPINEYNMIYIGRFKIHYILL